MYTNCLLGEWQVMLSFMEVILKIFTNISMNTAHNRGIGDAPGGNIDQDMN